MPIVFADEAWKRRNRRAFGKVAVIAAVVGSAAYLGSYLSSKGEAVPPVEQSEKAPATSDSGAPRQTIEGSDSGRAKSAEGAPASPNAPGMINCTVVDGDTVNCGGRRLRLLGVDAPELPGHCRPGRTCVEGNPFAASMALERLLDDKHLQIVVSGKDSYGRGLVNIYASGRNIACDLIAGGTSRTSPNGMTAES